MLLAAYHALRLTLARSGFYAGCIAAAIVAQAAIVLLWRAPEAIVIAQATILPVLSAIVYAFAYADTQDRETPDSQVWLRVLERSWAVIAIDYGLNAIIGAALGSPQSSANVFGALAGGLLLFLTALLLFADVSATVDDGDGTLLLIPRSIVRSVAAALYPGNILGAIAIVSMELVLAMLEGLLSQALVAAHVAHALLWASVPLTTVATVPIGIYTTLLYLRYRNKKPSAT